MKTKYQKRIEGQIEIEADISLISISSLNIARMEITLDLHLTQAWTDERCKFKVSLKKINKS